MDCVVSVKAWPGIGSSVPLKCGKTGVMVS